MADDLKYCKDCEHYGGANVCLQTAATEDEPDLVEGGVFERRLLASQMRAPLGPCGPEGKLWEADTTVSPTSAGDVISGGSSTGATGSSSSSRRSSGSASSSGGSVVSGGVTSSGTSGSADDC